MENEAKTKIIILAAGKGERMQSEMPKVLARVKGKPMISRLMESVKESGIDEMPTIIVGYKKELVISELGVGYNYVVQEEQLGTGHAVGLAKNSLLKDKIANIIILYGDQPFTSSETIKKISEKHSLSKKKITMATVTLPDFQDWRICFENFSRIVRNEDGKIIKSVEKKDATEKEKQIMEVNPCYFCFEANWLWDNLSILKNNNIQKEYYLTDLINIAAREEIEIESVDINPHEALGANTKEELEILERFAAD